MTLASLAPFPVATQEKQIVTTLLLLASGCLATTRSKSVSLRVFGSFEEKVFDEFCLRVSNEKLVRDFKI